MSAAIDITQNCVPHMYITVGKPMNAVLPKKLTIIEMDTGNHDMCLPLL